MAWSCFVLLVLAALAAGSPVPDTKVAAPARLLKRSSPLGVVDPIPTRTRGPRRPARPQEEPSAPAGKADDAYRLPTYIRPTLYSIELTPKLYGDFHFNGVVTINFNVLQNTKTIVLHSKELKFKVSDCFVYYFDGNNYMQFGPDVIDLNFNTALEIVTLTLEKELVAGSSFMMDIVYRGNLNDDLDGFYRSSYMLNGEQKWLATTQFEPTGARRAFPCWDEPSFKARFEIIIYLEDPNLQAISNMPVSKKINGTTLVSNKFMTSLPMSTYLVAFTISDFESLEDKDNHFATWARKEILPGGSLSQEIGPQALKLLGEFNGIDYLLPKMDNVAIPDFAAGAMENWGLVTYREKYLITTEDTTISQLQSIATVICHEFGHQWTGDLVTLDWWSHTWLNEGFATFFESMTCADIKKDWNLEDKMVPGSYHVAMESDASETQIAMSSDVSSYADIEPKFGVISYDKGGSVLRMFYHAITPEVFKEGVKRYINVNIFKNTDPEHLFRAISAEVDKSGMNLLPPNQNFSEIANTWTEQAGLPLVKVKYSASNKLKLTQERFFFTPPRDQSLLQQSWWIPISIVEQGSADWEDTKVQTWLGPDGLSASIKGDGSKWYLVNPKQTGYYRVTYDDKNWQLLAAAMTAKSSDFPAATRAQLINDATALARSGHIKYTLALPFFKAFKAERGVAPWQAAVTAYKYLVARLATTPAWKSLKDMFVEISADAYDSVGFTVKDSDSHEDRFLRYYMASYACYAGYSKCLSDASAALKTWLANPSANKLHPDTRSAALCYGVRGSDSNTFEAVRQLWQSEKDDVYAEALACSEDEALLKGLLSDALAMKYSSDDGVLLFNAIYDRYENHRLLLDFTKENAQGMVDVYQSMFDIQVLSGLIEDIRTRSEYDEMVLWVEDHYLGMPGFSSLDSSLATANRELESWFDKYYNLVSESLGSGSTWPSTMDTTTGPITGPSTRPSMRPSMPPTMAPPSGSTTNKPSSATTTIVSAGVWGTCLLLCLALRLV